MCVPNRDGKGRKRDEGGFVGGPFRELREGRRKENHALEGAVVANHFWYAAIMT